MYLIPNNKKSNGRLNYKSAEEKDELEILYNATVIKWRIEVTKRTQKVANPFENVQFG